MTCYNHMRHCKYVTCFVVKEKPYNETENSSSMAEKVTISIPNSLKEKIDEFLEVSDSEFGSLEEFILFLLSEFLRDEEDSSEDELLEKRLRALGYIE
jgi:Arc/MetJ-type ribon-helix-helix transcriptional regulator